MAAQQGPLRVSPTEAAGQLVAANVGVALSLISRRTPRPTRRLPSGYASCAAARSD